MILTREKFLNVVDELLPLFFLHRDEIDLYGRQLNIDFESYAALEEQGLLRIYTMRNQTKLVGYCVFYLYNHMHHKEMLVAKQDVLFVDRQFRGRGLSLLRYCDRMLKIEGVNTVIQCVPNGGEWGTILKRMGYHEQETAYAKTLGE